MANPGLSEIITTTLRNRSGKLADNVSKGNALLNRLNKRGNRRAASGRTIVEEMEYAEGTFSWYSGYEAIDITPADVITAAEFNWKQCAAVVSASGLEVDVQNAGKEAIINLLMKRIRNAERTMKNQMTIGMYADGTGNGGKEIGGLQLLVADDPTTGTVGGIDRSTAAGTFYRNQAYDATTDGGAAATAANIQGYMNTMFLRCTRGNDKPNIILADTNYYQFYWSSLQSNQRFTNDDEAGAGFTNLVYAGNVPVVYEDSSGIPANHMYFLNDEYLFQRYSPKRDFQPLENVQSINQDATVQLIAWAGNLTTSNASLQGILKD